MDQEASTSTSSPSPVSAPRDPAALGHQIRSGYDGHQKWHVVLRQRSAVFLDVRVVLGSGSLSPFWFQFGRVNVMLLL